MSRNTRIQWADSTLNLQMGCDGCELWNATRRVCYAGVMTDHETHGAKGWPKRFDEPELFLDRLPEALKWGDLTGDARPDKPWMDGLPRIVFLNDMGDTFSKKLPLDWLAPLLPAMGASRHQWLLLTKRPSRAVEFSRQHPFPPNFWLGTSVTSNATKARAAQLRQVEGGGPRFVSFEPLWENLDHDVFEGLSWAIFGGESGSLTSAGSTRPSAGRTNLEWILNGVKAARHAGARAFVKQLGTKPYFRAWIEGQGEREVNFPVKDSHGGEMREWPGELRVREMPILNIPKPPEQTSLL